jgi:hypothetical protein
MIKKSNRVFFIIILTVIVSASILFMTGCNTQTVTPVDNTNAIIVTVDGLSFVNTLVGTTIENSNNYLQTNLRNLINSGSIRTFTWSGAAGDTAAILASSSSGLRKFLLDNYKEARDSKKAFIVVGHSWGTFLTYIALSLEPSIQCDLFITMSSPLGTSSGLPASPEQIVRDYTDARLAEISFNIPGTSYPNAKVYYNFWANGDLISGPLSGKIPAATSVQDVKVDSGIADNRNVTDCYFWHKFTTTGNEVVDSSDPNYSVYTAYLLTLGILDISPTRNTYINKVVALIQNASGY